MLRIYCRRCPWWIPRAKAARAQRRRTRYVPLASPCNSSESGCGATAALQSLSFESLSQASGGLNGVSKGEVVSLNPPASSAEPWAQQDYKDAAMYYGAYPGAYYCGGEAVLFISLLICLFLVD